MLGIRKACRNNFLYNNFVEACPEKVRFFSYGVSSRGEAIRGTSIPVVSIVPNIFLVLCLKL